MLAALLLSLADPSLGGFSIGQSLTQAQSVAARSDQQLKFTERRGRWALYGIWTASNSNVGNVATCDGQVWSVVLNIKTYDDFTLALRQRVGAWGPPKLSFPIIMQADETKSFETLRFEWPQPRYSIVFSAKQADGLTGSQMLSSPVRTCT